MEDNNLSCGYRDLISCFRPEGACLPFTVRYSEGKGNIVVAVRDIKPFETIIIDTPAIVGPFDDTLPECPECYREVSVSGYKVRLSPCCPPDLHISVQQVQHPSVRS